MSPLLPIWPLTKFLSALFMTILWALTALLQPVFAQKFSFSHYDIEDGLIQSQAQGFCQDNDRQLWIATMGGLTRFDGKHFTAFTQYDGLANNHLYAILYDKKGRIWVSSEKGLSCIDKNRISNYPSPAPPGNWISSLIEESSGRLWALLAGKLYYFHNGQLRLFDFDQKEKREVTAISTDTQGNIWAALHGSGLFRLTNNTWKRAITLRDQSKETYIRSILFDRLNPDKIWLMTEKKLLLAHKNQIVEIRNKVMMQNPVSYTSIGQDYKGNIWLGSAKGAFYIEKDNTIYFKASNGLTDSEIMAIFSDSENNVWLGSSGNGIYKFDGNKFIVFDGSQGLSNPIVMGIGKDRNNHIWMSTYGNGLVKYDGEKLQTIKIPSASPNAQRISHVYTDKQKNVWLGTFRAGLWKFDGKELIEIRVSDSPMNINYINEDSAGEMWLTSGKGCFYSSKGQFYKVKCLGGFYSSVLEIGRDSMLVGNMNDLFILKNKARAEKIRNSLLAQSSLSCITRYGPYIFIGTANRGLLVYDLKNRKMTNYTSREGFNSDYIYSLASDGKGTIWAGTGRGLNKISFDLKTARCRISEADNTRKLIVECNQNAILLDSAKLWFGTTRGAIVYSLSDQKGYLQRPHIVLKSAELLSPASDKKKLYPLLTGESLKQRLVLPHDQNYFSISFQGIYFTNPDAVLYRYRLQGLDASFSQPVSNSSVNYPALPPGKYNFQVQAVTAAGIGSASIASFPFEIDPPFYQTTLFIILALLLLVLLFAGLLYYINWIREKRKAQIEILRQEERALTRKQTAEDFHDDLGNKLTRISVLSDILKVKMGNNEEQNHLVDQIQENTADLYRGTHHILWSLNPENDNLHEILWYIKNFGTNLFQETPIDFSFQESDSSYARIKLPIEYSRNITMIFKEALTNILKHSGAHSAVITSGKDEGNQIYISLKDDGIGFDPQDVKMGYGLENMYKRSKRINSMIDIQSEPCRGTIITLHLKIPQYQIHHAN